MESINGLEGIAVSDISRSLRAEQSFLIPRRIVDVTSGGGSAKNAGALTRCDTSCALIASPADGEMPSITLDFEREVAGMPFVELEPGTAARLVMDCGTMPEALWWRFEITLPVEGGLVVGDEFAVFRYMKITLRTLTKRPAAVSARIRRVGIKWTAAPMAMDGDFCCDDDLLNRIWRHALYTVEINCQPLELSWHMARSCAVPEQSRWQLEGWQSPFSQFVIWDGPRRDREMWLGDLRPSTLCAFYGFSNADVAPIVQNCHFIASKLQQPDGWIPGSGITMQTYPEYSMWWIISLWDHYVHMGEDAMLRRVWHNIRILADRALLSLDEDGLYPTPPHRTWAYTLNREGQISQQQFVFAAALRCAAGVARLLGHDEDGRRWQSTADGILRATDEALWLEDKGAYADYRLGGEVVDRVPLDANVLAIALRCVGPEKASRILDYIRQHHWTGYGSKTYDAPEAPSGANWIHTNSVWPFIVAYEVEARLMLGDVAGALEVTRACWGNMLKYGSGTFWEFAVLPGGRYTFDGDIPPGFRHDAHPSFSHAWSGYVSYLLQAYVLGVRPALPGFAAVDIEPRLGPLAMAQGRVPTPRGVVGVRVERLNDGRLSVDAQLPARTQGRLLLSREDAAGGVVINGSAQAWDRAYLVPASECGPERLAALMEASQ